MEAQCNHSQYPILMKQNRTHNPSTSQVSKSYHPNPVTSPYPPDPGEILTDDTNSIIISSAVRSATKTSPNLRLGQPKGEDQPQDLTSDVFVYGRPNPDGSDNTPPMPIINFDDLLGRTFLLNMDEIGGERGLPFLSMSRISVNNKSQEKISSDSSSRLMEINLMTSFHITNLWNTYRTRQTLVHWKMDFTNSNASKIIKDHILPQTQNTMEVATTYLLSGSLGSMFWKHLVHQQLW